MSRTAHIFFGTPLKAARVNKRTRLLFMKALNEVIDQGFKKLVVCITSEGGFCEDGFVMYHAMRQAAEQLELHTHAVLDCSSMAAVLHLAGDKRTHAPATMVGLHAASNADGLCVTFTAHIKEVYRDRVGWDEATCKNFFTATKLLLPPPEDLVQHNIFTQSKPIHIPNSLANYTIN
jgi:ATP-dependent protease ClpP protease subunit